MKRCAHEFHELDEPKFPSCSEYDPVPLAVVSQCFRCQAIIAIGAETHGPDADAVEKRLEELGKERLGRYAQLWLEKRKVYLQKYKETGKREARDG